MKLEFLAIVYLFIIFSNYIELLIRKNTKSITFSRYYEEVIKLKFYILMLVVTYLLAKLTQGLIIK